MKPVRRHAWKLVLVCLSLAPALAQTCQTTDDMEPATKSALVDTALRFYGMVTQGDVASLRQNAIASLASNFVGVEAAVTESKGNLLGVQPTARPPFVLKADGSAPLERAEFLCGIFGQSGQTANSAEFVIPGLPPGTYGIAILDAATAKGPYTVSFVLQLDGTAWKLAGFYVKPAQAAGHDAKWFADRAHDFKAKGEMRNAWLYAAQARELMVPVPFMNILATDKLYDEFQSVKPADLPPANITAGGKTFKVNSLFLVPAGKELDLIVKYASADISNNPQTFQDNMAVIKAVVGKYPEFRDGFDSVVARAVEPSGRDFGSMLPMKEIK